MFRTRPMMKGDKELELRNFARIQMMALNTQVHKAVVIKRLRW